MVYVFKLKESSLEDTGISSNWKKVMDWLLINLILFLLVYKYIVLLIIR